MPYVEYMPTSATNPYGYTKVMIEQILRDVAAADDEWSIALLRYFNPIGAHKSGLLGEDPNGIPNNLFPYIQQVAVGKREYLGVFGNDYDTPDGTGVRDYIHVVDLAKGHVKALDKKACGSELPYKIMPRRPGDIAWCYADVSKAKKLFGWEAKYGIDEMCEDGWRFIKQNPNGL